MLINPGTTGAAGIHGLQTGQETPYSMVLLHFFSNDEPFLKAADIIHATKWKAVFHWRGVYLALPQKTALKMNKNLRERHILSAAVNNCKMRKLLGGCHVQNFFAVLLPGIRK